MGTCPPFYIGRKPAPMNLEVGNGVDGANVNELAISVVWIVWQRINQGGEIPNRVYRISRAEFRAQLGQIEPPVVSPMEP